MVATGTSVNVAVEAITTPPAFGSVLVTNDNADGRSIDLYLIDVAQPGISTPEGTIAVSANKTIELAKDGHTYQVIAVDTGLLNCPSSDPFNGSCQRGSVRVLAKAGGAAYPFNVF
jgi:hypothetical protein